MANIMLSKMFEIADRGGTLPGGWYEKYLQELRKPWQAAYDRGALQREFLQMFDSEAFGYPCPVCGSHPEPYEKKIKFGNHVLGIRRSYRMDCDCEGNLRNKIREQKELEKRIIEAEIPDSYISIRWNDWDQTVSNNLSEAFRKVQGLSYGGGLSDALGCGMVLYGDVGRGKTHSAICWMKAVLENTKSRCKYIPMADFTSRILHAGQDGRYLESIEKYDVLMLDDLDKLSTASQWVQERVFSLFDTFFRSGKTLVLTTNLKTIPEMEDYFGSHGEAIVSRMADKMIFIGFTGGDDYRKKRRMEKMQNNQSKS